MRKRRTCYLLRCWSELFCSSVRASPAYIPSANGRECSRARSGLVLSARSSLVRPTANQNASLRQVVVAHQEHKRADGRESTWRERCAFSTFLKWTLGWHFSGTQRFFLVPLSRSLPLPPSRSLLLALYLLSLLNFHLGQVETCLKKKPEIRHTIPKCRGMGRGRGGEQCIISQTIFAAG